jgi:hypothetical protein
MLLCCPLQIECLSLHQQRATSIESESATLRQLLVVILFHRLLFRIRIRIRLVVAKLMDCRR